MSAASAVAEGEGNSGAGVVTDVAVANATPDGRDAPQSHRTDTVPADGEGDAGEQSEHSSNEDEDGEDDSEYGEGGSDGVGESKGDDGEGAAASDDGSELEPDGDEAVSQISSASSGSTEREFRAARDALSQLRESALARQELAEQYEKAREVQPIGYPTQQGVVWTVAGSGVPGFADGPAAEARFNSPQGIAITPYTPRTIRYGVHGIVYVADTLNHRVRTIDRDGNVTTLAGGRVGHRDGPVATARFNEPSSVAVDTSGDLYVVDRQNHCIRLINMKTMVVSTFAGSGRPR
jgi:hypothetical protein